MAPLFDANRAFTAGAYLTDGTTLWRILDIPEEQRKGAVPLEDCLFPTAPAIWREVSWLLAHKARVVRP